MAKIGILGGTFNPIHKGHIEIAKAAYEQYNLDEIWFMPNHIPAYKETYNLLSGDQRIEMIKLAIAPYTHFLTSDYEVKKEGKTYTYETMTSLKEKFPEYDFYFIMGADSLFYFDKWVHPEIITKLTKIIVASRNQASKDELQKQIQYLTNLFGNDVFHIVDTLDYPYSSTKIREGIQKEEYLLKNTFCMDNGLKEEVFQYILDNNLYKQI